MRIGRGQPSREYAYGSIHLLYASLQCSYAFHTTIYPLYSLIDLSDGIDVLVVVDIDLILQLYSPLDKILYHLSKVIEKLSDWVRHIVIVDAASDE